MQDPKTHRQKTDDRTKCGLTITASGPFLSEPERPATCRTCSGKRRRRNRGRALHKAYRASCGRKYRQEQARRGRLGGLAWLSRHYLGTYYRDLMNPIQTVAAPF